MNVKYFSESYVRETYKSTYNDHLLSKTNGEAAS